MDNFECDLLDNIRADSREERVMEVDELVEAELLPEASQAVEGQRAKAAAVATGHHAKAHANGADKGQVSEEEKLKISAVISHIRTLSKASEAQAALMILPLTQALQKKEKALEVKSCEIDSLQKALEITRNKNDELQNAVSLMDKRQAALEEVCQLAHLAEIMEPTTHEHAANSGDVRFQQVLKDFQIDSPEMLRDEFEKIFQLQHELEYNKHQFQADATRLAAAQRGARDAQEGLRMCQEESMTLKYKVRMLEEQLEQKCKLLREAEDAAAQNNLVRKGENLKIQPQLNDTVQTMDERLPVERPRHPLSGYQGKPFVGKKEVPRRYYEETEEILDESERYGRYGVVQEDERSPVRLNSAARHEDTELFSQFLITQSIPEPPVFSAAPGKLSISTFAKTFKMKFGTLPQEFQITLLETKYLEGKALKVFKGIPVDEKTTVEATLKAMALRLRVSVEDESRKAKTKWEALRRLDGQSIEDFCLQLDEIARVAFSRTPPEELSSLKTAKLMSALAHNHTIRCMIEVQLMDTEEVRHYDLCRMLATRFEFDVETSVGRRGIPAKSASRSPAVWENRREVVPDRRAHHQVSSAMSPTIREGAGLRGCGECHQTGCHDPACSRAPRSNNFTCFRCGEKGHFSNKCPQSQLAAPTQVPERPSVGRVEVLSQSKAESPVVENVSQNLGPSTVEKGRVGGVEVEMVIDSGATISLIPKALWKNLVKSNGKDWEKRCAVEAPNFKSVFTANNQPMKLIHQVKLETSLKARTREVVYHVADVERESVILGTNAFDIMGISMNIQGVPREVKLTRDIRLVPSSEKTVEVLVEGVVEEQGDCLVTPLVESLAPAICKVNRDGKAVLRFFNFGETSILLRKGQIVATGEVEGFDIVQEDVEDQRWGKELNERVGSPEFKAPNGHVCSVEGETYAGMQKFSDLCAQLRRGQEEENLEIWELVKEYQDVFALDDKELGRTHVVECEIELSEEAQPIRQKPRPIPLAVRPEIRKMLSKMLCQGVIRESKSPWSSPVVLVKKKDGSVRMCIDYRKVNKVVKNNAHPLPHIEATLQSLVGKRVFTTLDLLAGYWQIPLKEESKPITAFAIGSELFEWNVLPFGLVTSPAVFQAMMESVIGELLGKSAFVYVDDLLIASTTIEEHERDLREVLKRLRQSGLKLRATKCHIAQERVEYLGHQVTPEGVQTEEKKVERMKNFSKPTNAKELLSFLGLVGYYRKFIINFAQLAAPLTPLTSKKVCWKWEKEQEEAFQKLIQSVCQTPVLAQPDVRAALDGNRPFMIYTDASRQGVGAVLAQEGEDGMQHPIAFASKSLTPAETRYHVTDLEALAMMFALRRFKTIVYGTPVVVCTDHKPLISLLKGSPLADRLLRWSLEILEFNVKIVFVAGKANVVADALSRGGAPGVDPTDGETTELTSIINEVRLSVKKKIS
uniref:RNA-directed DNA polymerase n=2 Tax=Caenorhabditis japonica TaxID=281687 RepID=A0A8R1ITM5_CAEJA